MREDIPETPLSPVLGGEGLGVRGRGSQNPLTPDPSPPSTGERGAMRRWSAEVFSMTARVGRLAALVCLLSVPALRALADTPVAVEERLRRDITYLASNECEGRGVNTRGINLAADYIAAEFKKAGLIPPERHPGYFQPFTMAGD